MNSSMSTDYLSIMNMNTAQEQRAAETADGNAIDENQITNYIRSVKNFTNIRCADLVEALFYTRRDGYWNWFEYFYGYANKSNMDTTGDIPNPLILPTMFNPEQQCQVCVDSESTIPITDTNNYSLFRFLTKNGTKNVYSENVETTAMYKAYSDQLENMFNVQFNISPGENIRANTAQIPTLSYHGNMKVKQGSFVHEDIKCIGHLGNSYPGMASVREGRGMQTMNAPTNLVHLQ